MKKTPRTMNRAGDQHSGKSNPADLIIQTVAARLRGVTRAAISNLISRGRLRSAEMFGKTLVYRSEALGFKKQSPGPKRK